MARLTSAALAGGIHNDVTPTLEDQQTTALQVDDAGNLLVNVVAGGGGGGGTVTQGPAGTSPWLVTDSAAEASLATIAANIPPVGQALSAASSPVVLPAAQVTALTPPTASAIGTAVASSLSNPLPVSAASLPLPSNAAKETGGNLATIATNIPAQGQALAAASMPVVLTAAQLAALTPPAAITNFAQETGGNLAQTEVNTAPLLVSSAGGYVRQDSSGTIAKETGGNLATLAGTVSGGAVKVDGSAVTQPVSAASLPLPANASQEAGGNLATIAANSTTTLQILNLLTEIANQLRLLNLNLASSMPSAYVDLDGNLIDQFVAN